VGIPQFIYDIIIQTFTYNKPGGSYIPDPFGRITDVTKTVGGNSFTLGYQYDVMGRLTRVTYPTGHTVNYSYNKVGELTGVPGYIATAPTYENGLLKSITATNGVTSNYNYDDNGRLVDLQYQDPEYHELKHYALTYDMAGNIVAQNNDSYLYDQLNQVLYANVYGGFEVASDSFKHTAGRSLEDYKGGKSPEQLYSPEMQEIIELDYAAGSMTVDLLAPVKITRIELTSQSPMARVKARNLRVYTSQDNVGYTLLTDRYIKVMSLFDDRDTDLNMVNTNAECKNSESL
jgi:YD repeat-containing protein